MNEETPLLARIDAYIEHLFAREDHALETNRADAAAAGLPAINVSATQGKLLSLLVTVSGARRVLEIGTLGGYSTTWLARGLEPGGMLISLEVDPAHAEVAKANIARAVRHVPVTVTVGPAAETMKRMIADGTPPFDFIFIDADKPSYRTYLELALKLSRHGTVIVADNVIRNGLVMDPPADDQNANAARAFNAALAAHPDLDSTIVPIMRHHIDGLSISIVK